MPIQPIVQGDPSPEVRATTSQQASATQLIAELERAGLLAVKVDDDGDMSFALTARGRRSAQLMAMSRKGHALVLLGALVSADHPPN